MADRTFTEGEHYALVDDAIKRETAAATTRISDLEAQNTELKNATDVLETEKAAEKQRADQAVQALDDFKAQIEQEKAQEARRAERVAKVAEAAPLLDITQDRSDRIVAMSDDVFESYLSDLREVAAKAPKAEEKKDEKKDAKAEKAAESTIPRESAAFAGTADDNKGAGTVMGLLGASRALRSA
jgi:chromosome segregation ATPase